VFFFHHNQPKVRRLTQQDSLQYLGAAEDYTFLLNADKGIVLVLRAEPANSPHPYQMVHASGRGSLAKAPDVHLIPTI
jgi:hypothetical protein